MGSIEYFEKQRRGGRSPGKIDASLNEKLRRVKWGEYKLGELLKLVKTNKINIKKGNCPSNPIGEYLLPARTATAQNQGLSCYVPIKNATVIKNKISVSANGDYCAFWHNVNFTILQDSYALEGKNFELNSKRALFIISQMNCALRNKYNWANKSGWEKLKNEYIKLPTKNGEIDFEFMETFVAELQFRRMAELEARRVAELEAYLSATGLKDYTLTEKEKYALENYEKLNWSTYNLENLFGKSTRGKRLKSEDRIAGKLPFVTAGEACEGISAFIGNSVEIFNTNTITIDMFGSAKYRNYNYGGDDHIAVVHTEKLPYKAAVFITSAIHKSSHTGKFDYGHNFYAKDADSLDIVLPDKNGIPDYEYMELLISAIQKIVIKNAVLYADKQIAATQKVINKNF